MTKQSSANEVFACMPGSSRKEVIAAIVECVGCSSAYAATLYNNARKASAPTIPVVSATKPAATNSISSFDSASLSIIRRDLEAALELVEKKHGLKFEQGNIRYSNSSFRLRLECNVAGDPNVDSEKVKWDNNCFLFGLKPEQYGSTFQSGRDTFTVIGINPRAKKNCIIGRNARGTDYIFPARVLTS